MAHTLGELGEMLARQGVIDLSIENEPVLVIAVQEKSKLLN